MSKKILHLICNSHLDPVWQWDWDEGASQALATFYSACNLLDKYDFIFCHNEVLIYEYIEKFDPELFNRIQDLVAKGKWKIMGGWYIQPDCLVPSGESFIRQCSLGREYFKEKFNARPTTAINFDAFGHTRGIADILASCGFDSYVFCRPMPDIETVNDKPVPHGPFIWKGYSGKTVKAIRIEDENLYACPFGKAKESITRKEGHFDDLDTMPILWGVGNHGGTSSAKDLEDIMVLQDEKKGEWEIIHSSLEEYFKTVEPNIVYNGQMVAFIKSYTSASSIKLAHDELENTLYFAEKICTIADIQGKRSYNKETFKEAEKLLCQIAFHDVLSGTAIKTGIISSIRKAHYAIEIIRHEMYASFVALTKDLPKVTPTHNNLVVFNPYPYEYKGYVELEYYIDEPPEDKKTEYKKIIYDENGNIVNSQQTKQESEIRIDRRERMLFEVSLPAFSMKSYGCTTEIIPLRNKNYDEENDITVKDEYKEVTISRTSGLLKSYIVDNKNYLSGEAFLPVSFDDNEDPWGWYIKTLENNLKPFKLDKNPKGLFEGLKSVKILEDGPLMTKVQSLFTKGESHVVIIYKLYKHAPHIDVKLHVIWNEKNKGLKLRIPLKQKTFFAQMAFGKETYKSTGYEYPCNRYVGVNQDSKSLVIYNNGGVHGVSKKGKNLHLTLFNGSSYCAHPIGPLGDQILPDLNKYTESIEVGTHDYSFRISVNKPSECERISNEFNTPLYGLQYFPHGEKYQPCVDTIKLSNSDIVITALKKLNDGTYMIRLYNGQQNKASTELLIHGVSKTIQLGKYAFKTFIFDGQNIKESKDSSIY